MDFNEAVADTFHKISAGQRSGGLLCETAQSKRIVYFRDGSMVGARTNVPVERLGRLLLSAERLNKAQLVEATEQVRSGRKLGDVMVELGYLKDGEIEQFVRLQISDIAASMLLERPTKVVFSKKLGVQATTTRPVGIVEAFLKAASKLTDIDARAGEFQGKLLSLADDDVELPDELTNEQAAVVDALNLFPTSLEQLAASTGQDVNQVLVSVVGLQQCRLLETLDSDEDLPAAFDDGASEDSLPEFAEPLGSGDTGDDSLAEQPDLEEKLAEPSPQEQPTSDVGDFDVFTDEGGLGDLFGERPSPEAAKPTPATSSSEPDDEAASSEPNDEAARPEPSEELLRRVNEMDRLIQDNANDYHILGIEPSAVNAEVLRSFHSLCGELHPDLHQQVGDADFHAKLGSVFARITEAFQTLSRKPSREAAASDASQRAATPAADAGVIADESSSAVKDPEEAKQLVARAKRAYVEADYWNTIQLCRRAIEIGEDDAEFHFVLGQALAQNPRWRQDAEVSLKTATTLAPWNAKYVVALGDLYRKSGMDSRAKRLFAQAKSIDPEVKIPKASKDDAKEGELTAFGLSLQLGRSKAG